MKGKNVHMMPPDQDDPLVGKIVGQTYLIERPLAEGGMGSLYVAKHVRFDRRFAIKFLAVELMRNQEAFMRFRREAEIAGQLGHPNIVEVVDFNVTDTGVPYIVMELLDGEDLADLLKRKGRLDPNEAIEILQSIDDALETAHNAGIVHRDLKPQNIFLARKAGKTIPKVLDFGISKMQQDMGVGLTKTNTVMGTASYMAPEQAQGKIRDIDGRTDIFALGCIAYELLTGSVAFPGETVPAILHSVCYGQPIPVRQLVPEIPSQVGLVLAKAMAKRKEHRYSSAKEFVADLRKAIAGEAVGVVGEFGAAADMTQPVHLEEFGNAPRHGRGLVIAVLVGLVVAGGVTVGIYWFGRQRSTSASPHDVSSHGMQVSAKPTQDSHQQKKVRLRFFVTPKDAHATVFVDGNPVKGASVVLPKNPGKAVSVKVVASGYRPAYLTIYPTKNDVFQIPLVKMGPGQARTGRFSESPRRGRHSKQRGRRHFVGRTESRPVVQKSASMARPPDAPRPRPRPRKPRRGPDMVRGVPQARPDDI